MARLFNPAGSHRLNVASAVASAAPLTMGCWFNANNLAIATELMTITVAGSNNEGFRLQGSFTVSGDPIRAVARAGGTDRIATTSTGPTVNTWNHACGVFASGSSRTAYLNGGGAGTETTSSVPAGLNSTTIGAFNGATIINPFSGLLAEAAIWNVALLEEEVALLADGVSPLLVRPDSLVAYWPIVGRYSPEIDLIGGADLTVTGATVDDHPRIYLPSRALWTPDYAADTGEVSTLIPVLDGEMFSGGFQTMTGGLA